MKGYALNLIYDVFDPEKLWARFNKISSQPGTKKVKKGNGLKPIPTREPVTKPPKK